MSDRKKRLATGGYTGPGKPYIVGEFCGCRFPVTIAPRTQATDPSRTVGINIRVPNRP